MAKCRRTVAANGGQHLLHFVAQTAVIFREVMSRLNTWISKNGCKLIPEFGVRAEVILERSLSNNLHLFSQDLSPLLRYIYTL